MRTGELLAAWLYAMLTSVEGVFHELNMLRCPECGCRHRCSINHKYLDVLEDGTGPTIEFDESCAKCGVVTNYWGYGTFALPTTYTEELGLRWFMFKSDVKRFFRRRITK